MLMNAPWTNFSGMVLNKISHTKIKYLMIPFNVDLKQADLHRM